MKIRVAYVYPPIPDRRFDWSAVDDDTYEPGQPIGWGQTEQEAIADLMEQTEMIYRVDLTQCVIEGTTIYIEADSSEEAERHALDQADALEWDFLKVERPPQIVAVVEA